MTMNPTLIEMLEVALSEYVSIMPPVDEVQALLPKSLYVWQSDSDYAASLIGRKICIDIKAAHHNSMTIKLHITIGSMHEIHNILLDDIDHSITLDITISLDSAKSAVSDIIEWCSPFSINVSTDRYYSSSAYARHLIDRDIREMACCVKDMGGR